MVIKVIGRGCPKCAKLKESVRRVLDKTGTEAEVTEVKEMDEIMAYNVMLTPALVINEKVVATGRIPGDDQIEEFIKSAN